MIFSYISGGRFLQRQKCREDLILSFYIRCTVNFSSYHIFSPDVR